MRATARTLLVASALYVVPALAGSPSHHIEDPRFQMTLFAEQPQIWTPTGIAVDPQGRVFVIESNTHLPKPEYPGPKTDQIKVFTDKDNDGHADEVSIFAEGFRWSISIAFGGADLFLLQRDDVSVFHNTKTDAPEELITL